MLYCSAKNFPKFLMSASGQWKTKRCVLFLTSLCLLLALFADMPLINRSFVKINAEGDYRSTSRCNVDEGMYWFRFHLTKKVLWRFFQIFCGKIVAGC